MAITFLTNEDEKKYVQASELSDTINDVLTQAKTSGEFDGKPGLVWKGEWGASTTYSQGDVVGYGGSSYVFMGNDITTIADELANDDPTIDSESWSLLASKGDSGKDGTSVTVKSVSESTADGGSNVVTFSDGKTVTVKNGSKGSTGDTGQRGTGLLPVTTAPASYTTAVGGITPKYRMAISTIKTQAGVTEVLFGDTVRYSYYHYPISYLDASYAYFTTRVSIRGATGATGETPVKGTDYYTAADKTEMVGLVKAAMPTLTVTGIDEDGVSHTWLMYGVSKE